MFEHEYIDKYSFREIPINEDCLLKSEIYIEEFHDSLLKLIELKEGNPYEVGYGAFVVVRQVNENSIDLSWYPNLHTRFHEVSISIPKSEVKVCVGCWQYGVKPHIIVDDGWMEQLYTRQYSVFALVDAIGVKNAIRNNLLTKEKLLNLRDKLDTLSAQHKDISFISFADSLILKSNWYVGYFHKGINCSYEPEVFLRIIKEIREIYREVLDLEIYAVLTQGSNEYYEEPLLHISESENHICLNSIGVPFAELLAIESSAKAAMNNKNHPPAEIYMDEQYYHSLKFKPEFNKDTKPKSFYKAIMKTEKSYYFYSSLGEILSNFKN